MHPLFVLTSTALLIGVAAGALRGTNATRPHPEPMLMPTPPLHEMVLVPYESPEALTARLRKHTHAATVKQAPLLIGDIVVPLVPPVVPSQNSTHVHICPLRLL